ncbi:MAG TPA: thioesterase [Cycloclasticus sp.]|jgi:acyl-CoA thioesterase FadM|nr:thioesterase [Cycloclasticus sp.]HIL92858.1 thioesterase [Cycloclasticus sp.]
MARIIIIYPETTLYTHELSVRVKDLNIGNHLAHDSVISLLHEARAQFFEANNMSELDVEGYGIIMADIGVNYKAEAYFGQMLAVEITLGDFSSKGCDMYYRMSCKETGTVVAIAKTGLVFFDYEAKKPVAVPQSFLDIVK